jgi:hypothetical protein
MAILKLSHNQCTASSIESTLRRTIFHGFAVPFYNAKVYAALSFSDTAKSTLSARGGFVNVPTFAGVGGWLDVWFFSYKTTIFYVFCL